MAYREFGAPDAARVVICVHGLTRNGRDFDTLASALAGTGAGTGAGCRVVCPDVVGRGESGWLANPAGYGFPQYLADMTVLLARLEAEAIDWVGTSMGGLIGMMMAAQPGTPIRRLVLNDVGPFLPKAALARIGTYVGHDPHFADLDAAEAYVRDVHSGFGALSDREWRHLTETNVMEVEGRATDGGGGRDLAPALRPGHRRRIPRCPARGRGPLDGLGPDYGAEPGAARRGLRSAAVGNRGRDDPPGPARRTRRDRRLRPCAGAYGPGPDLPGAGLAAGMTDPAP